MKVTAQYFRQYSPYISNVDLTNQSVSITYVKQSIPLPDQTAPFELVFDNDQICYSTLTKAVMGQSISNNVQYSHIDFSGNRVQSYARIVNICDEIQFGVRSFLTGYNLFKKNTNIGRTYQVYIRRI